MTVEVGFEKFSSWEDFVRIAEVLKKEFRCRLTGKAEGPDAKVWEFGEQTIGLYFHLVCDDMAGNFLVAKRAEDKVVLEQMVRKIEQILENK